MNEEYTPLTIFQYKLMKEDAHALLFALPWPAWDFHRKQSL